MCDCGWCQSLPKRWIKKNEKWESNPGGNYIRFMPTLRVHYYLFQTIRVFFPVLLLHVITRTNVWWMYGSSRGMRKLCKKRTKKSSRKKNYLFSYIRLWKWGELHELHNCLCADIVCTRKCLALIESFGNVVVSAKILHSIVCNKSARICVARPRPSYHLACMLIIR